MASRYRRNSSAKRGSVYERVTARIVDQLQRGVQPWFQQWASGGPVSAYPLRSTGERYQGINVVLLYLTAQEAGYRAAHWFTFKQAQALGGYVRAGERGTEVVYASQYRPKDKETGEEGQAVNFLKAYNVFNFEQCDGLPERFRPAPPVQPGDDVRPIDQAERFFGAIPARIVPGNRACYNRLTDTVTMPPLASFVDAEFYYSTLAHELAHWTAHASRLNREWKAKRWGDEGYALEELVAEMGAAFTMAAIGLEGRPREDHASYLASWLGVLKQDSRAIFAAASAASKASEYLYRWQDAAVTV